MPRQTLTERDLRALRIFRAAAQAGGFTAAERLLGMSKATISRQIKTVEERLGVRLCLRGPRGFELTEAGYAALRCAKEALDALDRIFPEVDAMRGIISGNLKLGIADNVISNPASRITQALETLCRIAPDIQLSLYTMTSDELNLALSAGQVDIAIKGVHADRRSRSFTYLELFDEHHCIYRLASSVPGQESHLLPLVFRVGQPFVTHATSKLGYTRGPEATGIESVVALVATGLYAGILPVHCTQMLGPEVQLTTVANSPTYTVTQCALTNASHRISRAASRLLELLELTHQKVNRHIATC